MSLPRISIQRAASRRFRTLICGTRGPAISGGGAHGKVRQMDEANPHLLQHASRNLPPRSARRLSSWTLGR